MFRPLLAATFVIAALLPDALALAQQSNASQNSSSHTTSSQKTASSTKSQNAAKSKKNDHHKHGSSPWWGRSVYINAGSASQYLTPTSTPKPPPKNSVNTGGQVFKSIGN